MTDDPELPDAADVQLGSEPPTDENPTAQTPKDVSEASSLTMQAQAAIEHGTLPDAKRLLQRARTIINGIAAGPDRDALDRRWQVTHALLRADERLQQMNGALLAQHSKGDSFAHLLSELYGLVEEAKRAGAEEEHGRDIRLLLMKIVAVECALLSHSAKRWAGSVGAEPPLEHVNRQLDRVRSLLEEAFPASDYSI